MQLLKSHIITQAFQSISVKTLEFNIRNSHIGFCKILIQSIMQETSINYRC